MSVFERNGDRLRATGEAWTGVGETWMRQSQAWFDRASSAGMAAFRPAETMEQVYRLSGRLTAVNMKYGEDLMDAWLALTSAVTQHVSGLAEVFNDELRTVSQVATESTERLDEAAREQVREAERVARNQAQALRRHVRQEAASHYEELTKTELSEELARRDMPRSGTVEELRARLIEDDLKGTS